MAELVAALVFAAAGAAAPAAGTVATPCPTASQVDAELRRLGESATLERLGDSEVTVAAQTMRILLRDRTGATLGVREVVAPPGCAERVSLAAVLLVAWAKTWNETALPPSALPDPSVPRRNREVEVGIALGASGDGDARAPAGSLLGVVQVYEALGAALTAEVVGQRQVPVGPGAAAYALARLGAGPTLRLRSGLVWADMALLPQVTRLSLEGKGLMPARTATVWGASVEARGRAGVRWGRLALFIGLAADRALVRERLTLDDTNDTTRLSPWDFRAEAGVSWLFGRRG